MTIPLQLMNLSIVYVAKLFIFGGLLPSRWFK